ncbi:MAG: hypothetical protein IJ292_01805, partial [Clostridia bacterium]|nr:hypothetical protein [Clostridia bacterium]
MKKFLSVAVFVMAFILVLSVNVFAADYEIESLTVEDIYITEGIDGYYDENMEFNYYYQPDRFSMEMADGNTILGSEGQAFDGENYFNLWWDTVDTTTWTAGNTYTVNVGVNGSEAVTTYNVHVESNGIESIHIDGIEIVEGFNGYINNNGDFIYHISDARLTVFYTDGTKSEERNGFWYRPDIMEKWLDLTFGSDLYSIQEQSPWTAGNSYPVTAYIAGKSCTFNVKIVELPIENIEVHDIQFIVGVDNPSVIGEPAYTVYFKDGSKEDLDPGMSFACGDQWLWLSVEYYDGELTVGQTITRTATLGKFQKTYTVTAIENPVESVEIHDVEIVEGKADYKDEYGNYHYGLYNIAATLHFKDGSTEDITSGFNFGGRYYGIQHNGDEIQANGTYWVLGGEYTLTGSIFGCTDTFKVSIVPIPIKNFEVKDVAIYENTNGWEEDGVFYYDIETRFTVTLNDDSTDEGWGGIWIDGEWYSIELVDFNQYETPLLPGNTYTVTARLGTFTSTFDVTIKPSPIKKLDIKDVYVYENTSGYYNSEGDFYYYIEPDDFTVTYLDGSTGDFEYTFVIDDDYFNIDCEDTQHDTLWTVGTHTVTGTLLGVSDEFNVIVLESPISSIVVDDIDFIFGLDYRYDIKTSYTVYYKDGTSKRVEKGDLAYIAEDYYDELKFEPPYEEVWQVGDSFTITAHLSTATTTFKLNIVETPVKSIELIQKPTKLTYVVGEAFDPTGSILRINYKDNSYEDFPIDYYRTDSINDIPLYSKKLEKEFSVFFWGITEGVGKADISVDVFGEADYTFEVDVVENKMESISLSVGEDKRIVITVTYTDGSTEDMYFLGVEARGGGQNDLAGNIITDKGVFSGGLSYGDSLSLYIRNGMGEDDIMQSNTIANCEWWNAFIRAYRFDVYPKGFASFSGSVTKDNINNIIAMSVLFATYEDDFDYPDVISGKYITDLVNKYFAVDNFDITMSSYYDAEKDIFDEAEEFNFAFNNDWSLEPFDIKYVNGEWITVITRYNVETGEKYTLTVKCDDNLKIKEFINADPVLKKNGWKFENNTWYYYENGVKVTNDWRKDSTGWCFLDEEGKWVIDAFVKDSVGLAYITKDGYFYYNTNGWVDYHGTWYYVENGYAVVSAWRKDSTGWCFLDENGKWVRNAFVKDSVGWAY